MLQTTQELQSALFGLNSPDNPFTVQTEGDKVVATWNFVDAKWLEIFAKAGMKETYKMVLKFNEAQHQVSYEDQLGSVEWRAGVPSVSFSAKMFKGQTKKISFGKGYGIKEDMSVGELYNFDFRTDKIKTPIFQTIEAGGWTIKNKDIFSPKLLLGVVVAVLVLVGVILLGLSMKSTPEPVVTRPLQTYLPVTVPVESATPVYSPVPTSPRPVLSGTNTIETIYTSDTRHGMSPVSDTQITFSPSAPYIQVTALVELSSDGVPATVTGNLTKVDTGAAFGPYTVTFDTPGAHKANYAFKAPATGWESGRYKLQVRVSNGNEQTVYLTVSP